MNHLRRILSIILVIVMILSMAVAMAGCDEDAETPEQTEDEAATGSYSVTVRTKGGMAMEGLDVYIYADNTLADLKQYGETDENGSVSFQLPESSDYAIAVSGAPKGYEVEPYYTFSGNSAAIELTSSPVAGENLSGASLGLGDVIYDFSVTTPGGDTVTLSEVLSQKKMVLLNFWYTTCTYCVAEFPYMEEAYEQYSGDVGIIAVDPLEEDNAITVFQEQNGLTFTMAKCPASWSTTFSVSGYPTSIIIDRYGVICLIEVGGMTSLQPFISIFDHFTAEDYEQQLYSDASELLTAVKPTYEMDTSENIGALINSGDISVTYRPEEGDEYSWPFIATEKNGEACLKASNQEIESSYAILYADIELKQGQAIAFDYLASTELNVDIMYVLVNEEPIYSISGTSETEAWEHCYPWVALEDGTYELALCYLKDDSINEGDDTVYIKNMHVVDASEIDVPTYIPRYAAVTEDGFDYTYADIVLNETDGYYHVGAADGPLLLADLMNYTQFNEEKTVWEMAYDNEIVLDGHDYYDELVNYCSYASNSSLNGICTVNEELAELLKIVAKVAGFDGGENEWLKICKYYQAYGAGGAQIEDPVKGLASFSAYEAKLGVNVESNYFYYDRAIIPRGLLAEFTPTTSGVYRITSRNDSEEGVDGWIFDENRECLYTYEASERSFNDDGEVSMVYYMEAGTPYYIDIAFWDMYNVGYIYYDIEYLGSSYELFRTCAPAYFTYDSDATGDEMYYLITGGIDVVLGKDGYYYEDLGVDANGNQKYGSLIYCDFTGTTGVFSSPIATTDVAGMIDLNGFDFSKTEEDLYVIAALEKNDYDKDATDAYLKEQWGEDYDSNVEYYQVEDVYAGKYHGTGADLTGEISTYLDDMITMGNAELQGCVPVTERLAEILQMLMDKFTFENVENSWLKICYYYQYLGPEN